MILTRRKSLLLLAAPAIIRARAQVPTTHAGKGAPGGGGAFSPGSLPNLIGWYKADVGVTNSGGNTTNVTDQSSAGNNLVNNGTVPFSATGYTGSLGNKPAWVFDNWNIVNGGLVTGVGTTGTVTLPAVNAFTFWTIGQCVTGGAAAGRLCSLSQGSGNDYSTTQNALVLQANGPTGLESGCNNVFASSSSFTRSANHRVIVTSDGSTTTIYIDGASAGSGSVTMSSLTTPTNILFSKDWTAGAVGNNGWGGPICELGIAMSFANATTVGQIDGYLVGKWGS